MKPASLKLHQTLIRLAKGMLSAWEEWVRAHIQNNPDPVQHFKEVDKEIQQRRT
jgi:hypothetical protein